MRTFNWILLGIATLLIVGCGIITYDYLHDTTYTLHYDGFTIEVDERRQFRGLFAAKVDQPDGQSPFEVRIEDDGPLYAAFEIPEHYMHRVWKYKRLYDNRPTLREASPLKSERNEKVSYPLSTEQERGRQTYYTRSAYPYSPDDSFSYEEGEVDFVEIYDTSIRFPFEPATQCWTLYGKQKDVEQRLGPPKRITSESHLKPILPFR
jgi:hypothetical protein